MNTLLKHYLNSNNEDIINIMKSLKLISTEVICNGTSKKPHPEKKMALKYRKEGECNWRCNNCGTRKTITIACLWLFFLN